MISNCKKEWDMDLGNITVTEIISAVTVYSKKGRLDEIKNRAHFGISLCIDGQITYIQNGKEYISEKGCAVILPKNGTYYIKRNKTGAFPVINFECADALTDTVCVIPIEDAEELIMDDISTGASNDIQQATRIAKNMVTRYGMSDKLGTVIYGSEHSDTEVFLGRDFNNTKNYSEKIAAEIDDEVRAIIESAYAECKKILTEHIDKLHLVAGYLLKTEFMDGDQFKAAMENDLTFDEIDEIAREKERKSREENEAKKREEEEEQRKVEEELRREKEERERMMNAPQGETFDDTPDNDSESVDKE